MSIIWQQERRLVTVGAGIFQAATSAKNKRAIRAGAIMQKQALYIKVVSLLMIIINKH
jgi:hypothetical protein